MNTKTIVIIFVVAILITGTVGFYMLMKPTKNSGPSTQAQEGDIAQLSAHGKVIPVAIAETGVTPPSIKLNKGEAINFANTTKQDLELKITGKLATLIKITAGKSQISPIFVEAGTSKFEDSKNKKINGTIIVGGGDIIPTSAPAEPLFVSQGIITITDNGATPSRADVAVGKSLQIVNKTSGNVTFKMTGKINENIVVPAGKTVSSKVFREAGEIKAVASNNENVICMIEVK